MELERIVTAHELGHAYPSALEHVEIGCFIFGGGGRDAPTDGSYEPANHGWLWDVPYDPFLNYAISGGIGGDVADFMSYACRVWISGESWNLMHYRIG